MSLPEYIPRPGDTLLQADRWIRAVTAQLKSMGSTSRVTRNFTFNSAHPPTVTTPSPSKPAGVLLLAAAQPKGVGPVTSGAAVTWTWTPSSTGGAILVTAIEGLAASTDYDVTIEIVGA